MLDHYDYLVVGSGLFGSTFANEAKKKGKKVLVVEKRKEKGGNISTEVKDGITIHTYGAHIFHTSDKEVWSYVTELDEMKPFVNSPIAIYKNEVYNMPFNMNTFSRMWNIKTPEEAEAIIDSQRKDVKEIKNHIHEASEGVHRKAVGTIMYRASTFHHKASSCEIHI